MHSVGASSEAVIQSGRETREIDRKKKRASHEYNRIHSVEVRLLRSRHSDESDTEKEREQRCGMHLGDASFKAAIQSGKETREGYTGRKERSEQ
jgi:hypothetical protein